MVWFDLDKTVSEMILLPINLKSIPNITSKIGQIQTWENIIICIKKNICLCLHFNTREHIISHEDLNWGSYYFQVDNI